MKNIILILLLISQYSFAQLANWTAYQPEKFPTNLSGQIHGQARIVQMKFHPSNPNKYYAVTAQGGLFISNDQAATWTVAAGTDVLNIKNASICIDYTNDQILYLGGGDPNYYGSGSGIYKSTNGGTTFTQLTGGIPTNKIVVEIIQHPTDPNTLVAATSGGIYKSTNAGTTWAAQSSTSLQFCDMKQGTAANSQILFASTTGSGSELYRSTDFGTTWTQITSGISVPSVAPIRHGGRIGVTPVNPDIIYFGQISSGGMMYKSTDGGLNFTLMKGSGSPYITFYNDDVNDSSQGNYNYCITVDRLDANKIWLQSHNTWYSSDGGVNWTMLTHWASKVHTDMHQIGQSPYDATKLYSCNDGGVWLSTDGGNNWTPKNDGIYAFEIPNYAGKGSPTRRDFINIGTQDNGELYADSTGWYTIRGGDWYAHNDMDYRANSTMLYYHENAKRRFPTGSQATFGLPDAVKYTQIVFNRTNIQLAFAGLTDSILRTTDIQATTPTWTLLAKLSGSIKAIHSSIANSNYLYVITEDQKIHVSSNALDVTPTFTTYNLPSALNSKATITAICNNANILYISINNKVYRSANAGANWTDITYNLPSANHQQILSESYGGTEELVFIATANAVYYKKAGQTTWTLYSTNLPNRQFPTDLSIYDDGTNQALLRWATYGRGIWQTPFGNLRPLQAYALAEKASNVCTGNQFNFKNASNGNYNSVSWSFPSGSPSTSTAENPTVTYSAIGTYIATVTVTDASGATSSTNIPVNVTRLDNCSVDGYAGKSLKTTADGDYFVRTKANLTNITHFSVTAWIKPNGTQNGFAGIVSNGTWGAHYAGNTNGLVFDYNGNKLWYRWAGIDDTWGNNSGLTVPLNEWSYVAMVLTPDSVALYLNDQKYVYIYPASGADKPTAGSFSELYLGYGHYYKYFKGEMDEVSIWNRALTQNEIRDMRHLTKENMVSDANLIAYYQFNDVMDNQILDKKRTYHGAFVGNTTLAISTAPIGTGVSERLLVKTGGLKTFAAPNVDITFPNLGIFPNGEIVVTRLNVGPDQNPTGGTAVNKTWIINNYGANATFTGLNSLKINDLTGFGTGVAANCKLYKRAANAEGATWTMPIDGGDVLASNVLTFNPASPCLSLTSFGQFTITDDVSVSLPTPCVAQAAPTQSATFTGSSTSNFKTVVPAPNFGTSQDFTISFWVKSANAVSDATILCDKNWSSGTNKGWVFGYRSTSRIRFNLGDGTNRIDLDAQTGLNDNQWHHIAASVTRTGNAVLYVDGVSKDSESAAALSNIHTGYALTMGTDALNNYPLSGQIDEIKIWNIALSQDQIREKMHLTTTSSEANLLHYYQFNDASTSEFDLGSQGNNLTKGAAATRSNSTAPVGAGTVARMTVTASGIVDFAGTDCQMQFPTGTSPNGEIMVSALTNAPDQNPTGGTPINKYWIIDNFGTNPSFATLTNIKFNNLSSFGTGTASDFKLYKRNFNAEGATWSTPLDAADDLTTNNLTFTQVAACVGVSSFGQFTVTKDAAAVAPTLADAECTFSPTVGKSLSNASNGDYVLTPPLNLNKNDGSNNNEITLMAWIRPTAGTQSSYTGILTCASGIVVNLNLRENNELGLHWNGGEYNWSTGLTVPADQWSHVALVANGTSLKLYLNGVAATRTMTVASVDLNNRQWYIGRDRTNSSRTFKGLIDEICFYNRALSQNEIREQMHLVKSSETALKGYFQFNETNSVIWNKVDANYTNFSGSATRATSTAPVGTGTSQRMTVTTGGVKDFANQHLSLEFPSSGTLPNGEIVVTELAVSPDQTPASASPLTGKYWIIQNHGSNATFAALTSLQLSNLGNFGTGTAANYRLYKRSSGFDGATWGSSLGSADALSPVNNNTLTFGSSSNITSFSQITLGSEAVLPVELLAFQAFWNGKQVDLTWKVADERDVDHYEMEYSEDGRSFGKIATVPLGQFSVSDDATAGIHYYRLKIVERDGQWTYSNIQSVTIDDKSDLQLYPNPVRDILHVSFQSKNTQQIDTELVNTLGQVVQRHSEAAQMGENRFVMPMNGQISGMYTLRLVQGRQVYIRRVCLR